MYRLRHPWLVTFLLMGDLILIFVNFNSIARN